jgi:hypothetical protein
LTNASANLRADVPTEAFDRDRLVVVGILMKNKHVFDKETSSADIQLGGALVLEGDCAQNLDVSFALGDLDNLKHTLFWDIV